MNTAAWSSILTTLSVLFLASAFFAFWSSNALRKASEQRHKIGKDVERIIDNANYDSGRDRLQARVDSRNDMKNAVRAVVREMDLQVGYEVDCIAIPHTLLQDARYENGYDDERFGEITIKFKGTGAQWEELKQKLEKVNGRTSSEEKVQPKTRDGKGA